ncbi:hypothetical protein BOX15_Mlig029424g1 [Macrostomum lignano]|uniref:WSC domain-containing protein n=1 Tax=Macrostomum lignano TaxID=282301 RepID=A0A267DNI0_9PLAT|nr:hypothetical protein BOX15_Mlig007223g4 [Macrostomum lignano]PAA50853.1 hypothetical protein BOX15_Mlig007223g2 [Macrostomum lignano]PAA59151.1 hypothetical protein BOX15_Mlig029424g1 [Macrostomum lignano]
MLLRSAQLRICIVICSAVLFTCSDSCIMRPFKKKKVDEFINTKVVPTRAVATLLGCFVSGSEVRDLPVFAGSFDANSPNNCNDRCHAKLKKYFGLHNGKECWCGDSYGNISPNPATLVNCYMPCPGNSKEKCGGPKHNSVYNVSNY